jgi:dTDP-4-dehydrorhamnose reductase
MRYNKVLVTGGGGMLGAALLPYFRAYCGEVLSTDQEVSVDCMQILNVTEHQKVTDLVASFQPNLILHLAAVTGLEYCEDHPQLAEDVNATATRHIATLARKNDVPLVYISTANVFDGNKTSPYIEADLPAPIMVYGQTKYDGEQFVRAICEKYYVIRAGWLVGGGVSRGHKFVHKILAQILEGKKTLHVVDDKFGTPTYTHDFAMNLFKLLAVESYGTYHMVCEGSGSRYDVAKELVRLCGLEGEIELVAVGSGFFKDDYFAPRPASEVLLNANLEKEGLNLMRNWKVALSDYLEKEYSQLVRRAGSVQSAGNL